MVHTLRTFLLFFSTLITKSTKTDVQQVTMKTNTNACEYIL